jgi:hypothetical protein
MQPQLHVEGFLSVAAWPGAAGSAAGGASNPSGCLIEAPWLANSGHGASLRQLFDKVPGGASGGEALLSQPAPVLLHGAWNARGDGRWLPPAIP